MAGAEGRALERLPLKQRILKNNDGEFKKKNSMDPKYAIVYCLNYAMGSGFLTLPRAFVDAGIMLGSVLTVLIALFATISAECLLDVMARLRLARDAEDNEEKMTLSDYSTQADEGNKDEKKKYFPQVSDICSYYLGVPGNVAYLCMLLLFMYGSLWGYAAIFGASFAAHAVIPGLGYRSYIIGFGIIVAPLACRDLAEQKKIQLGLAVGRTFMLVLMIATALSALVADGPLHTIEIKTHDSTMRHILSAAPIIAFSCTLHHSVPQICAPVDTSRSSPMALNYIFRIAFFFAASLYVVFATSIALFFGDETKSAVNLDWTRYSLSSSNLFARAAGTCIQRFIVLYPAINVISTYPLVAVTLGDALYTVSRSIFASASHCLSAQNHPFGDWRLSPASHFLQSDKTQQDHQQQPTLADLSYHDLIQPDQKEDQEDTETNSVGIPFSYTNTTLDSSLKASSSNSSTKRPHTTNSPRLISSRQIPPCITQTSVTTTPIHTQPQIDDDHLVKKKNFFRLLAALPPLLAALFADDISEITRFTGVFGLGMCFAVPALLALVAQHHLPGPTTNSSYLNSKAAASLLLVSGVLLALIPLVSAASTHLEQYKARTVSPHFTPHYLSPPPKGNKY